MFLCLISSHRKLVPAASHRAEPNTYPDDRPAVVDDLVVRQCRPVGRQDPEDGRRLGFGADAAAHGGVHVVELSLASTARDLRRI